MSGHNKWSTIKHRKGAQDSKRGKIFTKLIKEITVAARFGGGDPNSNPSLRTAIVAAKAENMPKDNIERAIKKGTGELESITYEENVYEGYGPGGAAILVNSLTDNKNRAVAEIRHIFNKYGGNLGENGCVSWIFNKKGFITVEVLNVDEDSLIETVLDAGAEDIWKKDNLFEIITSIENFNHVKHAIDTASILCVSAEITMIPQNTTEISEKDSEQMFKMLEALDDCYDVQKVYTNTSIKNI